MDEYSAGPGLSGGSSPRSARCTSGRMALLDQALIPPHSLGLRLLLVAVVSALVGAVTLLLAHTVLPGWKQDFIPALGSVLRAASVLVLGATLPLNVWFDTLLGVAVGPTDLFIVLGAMLPWLVVGALVDRWLPMEGIFIGSARLPDTATGLSATWPLARLHAGTAGITLESSTATTQSWRVSWRDLQRVEAITGGVRLIVRGREAESILFLDAPDLEALLDLLERHGVDLDRG